VLPVLTVAVVRDEVLPLPEDLSELMALFDRTPWLSNLGRPEDGVTGVRWLRRFDDWPGPEASEVHSWFDHLGTCQQAAVDADASLELQQISDTVLARVRDVAAVSMSDYSPDEDAWHGPTLSVRSAGHIAATLTAWQALGWSLHPDLAEAWGWMQRGHWPCGLAMADTKPQPLMVL
jgi:hypothetical protein